MRQTIQGWVVLLSGLAITCASWSLSQAQDLVAANQYVDSSACTTCHADIARSYSSTGMARSFSQIRAADLPNPKPYFHAASSTWYQMVAKADSWVQRSWQIGLDGQPENIGESRIDYVMGSGNHVRTYLHRTPRGTLTMLPLAWYSEGGGSWALNPGLDVSDPGGARKIGYDCMFCHNSYPSSIPPGHEDPHAEPVYPTELPQGIDCQRCHGPGGNHLRVVSQAASKLQEIRASILNPGRLSKDRGMEVCMQCHLETSSFPLPNAIRRFERAPFSYRPGEPLSSFELFFDHQPGTNRDAKFEIVNSAYRLRQSQCFLQSKGELGCTTCHNPHDIRHGQEASGAYNQKCVGCHPAGNIAVEGHPTNGDCVSCHMPQRRTEDVVHAVMTDHLIQRRAPSNLLNPLTEKSGSEADYRGEVVPYGEKDDLYTSVAQVMHRSNLEAGIPRLQTEIDRRKPSGPQAYLELGDALQKAGRFSEAAGAYRTAIEKAPTSAFLWARLAMPLRAMGRSQEPLDALRKALELDPNDSDGWYQLGLLQSDLKDKPAAIDSFRKSIALDPESADNRRGLGIALAETGQLLQAETELRAALTIRPAMESVHEYLAYLLVNRGELNQAVWHYARAGSSAPNQFNYGITLARMNRLSEARQHLEQSLQADPRQPVAHELVGRLLEAELRAPDAMIHYREAIRLQPNFGRAHASLGGALLRQGDRAGAAAEFRAAQFDADPEVRAMVVAGLSALGVQ